MHAFADLPPTYIVTVWALEYLIPYLLIVMSLLLYVHINMVLHTVLQTVCILHFMPSPAHHPSQYYPLCACMSSLTYWFCAIMRKQCPSVLLLSAKLHLVNYILRLQRESFSCFVKYRPVSLISCAHSFHNVGKKCHFYTAQLSDYN